ncbi:MAG: glycosyltransferase [Patescibacteria group bacterium]
MNSYTQGKSGGDMVFIEIAKRLTDFDLTIVGPSMGARLCRKSGLKAKYLITSKERKFGNVIKTYLKRMSEALSIAISMDKDSYDILLGTSDVLTDILPIFYLKLKNPKALWVQHTFHMIPRQRPLSWVVQRIGLLLAYFICDVVIVDSYMQENAMLYLRFDPSKIEVNYPGIDLEYLESISENISTGYDGVFMAQLRKSKGVFELIKIWKKICLTHPDARLGIIGKGNAEVLADLNDAIKRESLSKNVDILGFLPNDKAFSTIKSSKVFVFPSSEEGFGISFLESQALGVPVVAWDLPVFDEVFPKGSIKVNKGKLDSFAEKVTFLLDDKKSWNQFSKDAMENSRRFTWDITAKKELEIINKFLGKIK